MKCPYCNGKLTELSNEADGFFECQNAGCFHRYEHYPEEIWQALLDGKRAQDAMKIAVEALKDIQWFCHAPTTGERAIRMQQRADKTLAEIVTITKE